MPLIPNPNYGINPATGNINTGWVQSSGGRRSSYSPSYGGYGDIGYGLYGSSYRGGTGGGSSGGVIDAATVGNINLLNRQAQQEANLSRIPGAAGLEAQSSEMIGQQLAGELPADVMGLIGRRAAETAVMSGRPGAPASNAAYLRALGLTSLEQQQAGQQNLTAAYARNPAAPIYGAENFAITPLQAAQLQYQYDALNASMRNRGTGGGGGGGGSGGGALTVTPAAPSGYNPGVFVGYSTSPGVLSSGTDSYYNFPSTSSTGTYGYQPTSSGSMYVGSAGGYNPAPEGTISTPQASYYDYGLGDIFGNYGG